MIDMKRAPEPKQSTMLGHDGPEHDEPRYPWGLEIRLEGEELQKLGISQDSLPAVGAQINLTAIARVTTVRSEATQSGGKDVSVSLQIEQMELSGAGDKGIAQRMYGASGMNA